MMRSSGSTLPRYSHATYSTQTNVNKTSPHHVNWHPVSPTCGGKGLMHTFRRTRVQASVLRETEGCPGVEFSALSIL